VISRTRFQQPYYFRATVRSALHNRVYLIFRQKLCHRNPRASRVAWQRNHRIAVPAQYERGNILDRNVQRFCKEATHSRRIQHASHANDTMLRETRTTKRDLTHSVQRIRDYNQNRIWRIAHNFVNNLADNVRVRLQKIVAAHARLSWQPGCDNDYVRPARVLVTVRAKKPNVVTLYGRSLRHIQRL